MLTLFHAPWSRSGRIVRLLEEIGADYQIAYVGIRRNDGTGARDPANPHPDGKVPALADGDVLVTESAAIALYLTDLFRGAKLGGDIGSPDRGAYLTWMAWTVGELEPALWSKISGETETNPYAQARYEAAVDRLLRALAAGPWLMGRRFTAVDVMAGGAMQWARDHLPAEPIFEAYFARLDARPAAARAAAKDAAPSEANAA
jgi:glutathione S-transferase